MAQTVSESVKYIDGLNRGELVEAIVDIYESADGVRSHDPSTEMEDTKNTKRNLKTQNTGGDSAESKCDRMTTVCVCLGLLCVLLLAAITALWLKFSNLTKARDQLQTSFTNLTVERDQLQIRCTNMTLEKEQLQIRCTNLTLERDKLQTSYNVLVKEIEKLQKGLMGFGWNYFNSSLYYISSEKKMWRDSRKDCIEKGADLVIINSKEEQVFIDKSFRISEAWIGLTDSVTEGDWRWVDNKTLTTGFWWDGEPNDYGKNEDCAITGYRFAASTSVSTWADYPCNHHVLGICEKCIG